MIKDYCPLSFPLLWGPQRHWTWFDGALWQGWASKCHGTVVTSTREGWWTLETQISVSSYESHGSDSYWSNLISIFFLPSRTLTALLWNQETVTRVLLLLSFLHFIPNSVAPNLKCHKPLIPEVTWAVPSSIELRADFLLHELVHFWIWLFIFYSAGGPHGAVCQWWGGYNSQIRLQPSSSLI